MPLQQFLTMSLCGDGRPFINRQSLRYRIQYISCRCSVCRLLAHILCNLFSIDRGTNCQRKAWYGSSCNCNSSHIAATQITRLCHHQYMQYITYTLCFKKVPTFILSVTLSNLNRFSHFLHCWKAYEIYYKTHTTIPTSLSACWCTTLGN